MSAGVATLGSFPKSKAGGGGGTVTGAINGVSLSGSNVVLGDGGDGSADLLNNRSIGLNGHGVYLSGLGQLPNYFTNFTDETAFGVGWANIFQDSGIDKPFLKIGDPPLNAGFLLIDPFNGAYRFGDADGIGNGNNLFIDDASNLIDFIIGIGGEFAVDDRNGFTFLDIDTNTDQYHFGDLTGEFNGLRLEINDFNQEIHFGDHTPHRFLSLDVAANVYQLGDIDALLNNTRLVIGDTAQHATIFANNGFSVLDASATGAFLDIEPGVGLYGIGDLLSVANGTSFQIDDTAKTFIFNGNGGVSTFFPAATSLRIAPADGLLFIGGLGTNNRIELLNSGGTGGIDMSGGTSTISDIGGGAITIGGTGIKTGDPGSGAGTWKLGTVVTAASVLDATRYAEVSIGGVVVKLAIIT